MIDQRLIEATERSYWKPDEAMLPLSAEAHAR